MTSADLDSLQEPPDPDLTAACLQARSQIRSEHARLAQSAALWTPAPAPPLDNTERHTDV